MASRCPRIQISPSPDVSVAIQTLAKLLKQPQSRIVAELLDEALPALQMTIQGLQMAKRHPGQVEALLSQFSTKAINELTQQQMVFSEAMKAKPGRKPAAKKGARGRTA